MAGAIVGVLVGLEELLELLLVGFGVLAGALVEVDGFEVGDGVDLASCGLFVALGEGDVLIFSS